MSITFNLATRATLVTLTTSSPVSDLLRMVPPLCTVCVNHIRIDPRKHAGVLGTPLATLGLDPDVVHHVQVDSPPVQIFIKHASCGTRTLSISIDATVADVKQRIIDLLGLGPNFFRYHRLHYGGKDMSRGQMTLRACGIQRESTLFTIGRLVGGGKRTREQEMAAEIASLRAQLARHQAGPPAKKIRSHSKSKAACADEGYICYGYISWGFAILDALRQHRMTLLQSMRLKRTFCHGTSNRVRVKKTSMPCVRPMPDRRST